VPSILAPFWPRPSPDFDRDPLALLLAALAVVFALLYLVLGARGADLRHRARVIAAAAVVLVVAPSAAFMAMGFATGRPYGQDGGVVQLPLALDKILSGETPYGADYSGTMLGRQARASSFWDARGENPILHHHAYLPGTHLVMAPLYLVARGFDVPFDPRLVTLLFYVVTIVLASRLPADGDLRLTAAGVAALNPLVYWHQIFGANDLVFVALVLGAVLLARAGRATAAGAVIGLACATKQLAWPFAPFLLLSLTGARRLGDLARGETWARLRAPLAAAAAVFLGVVLPVAALDFRAFWGDIVVYNVGLPGADNYPLGGTPGFGFANFLIYFGRVQSLREYVPLGVFYLILVPLGLFLVRRQLREETPVAALYTGTAALLSSLYFSRVVHPNYLIPAAVLLPLAFLGLKRQPDVALVPLLLLLVAVEIAENAVFLEAGVQAAAAGFPARLGGLAAALGPRAGPDLTPDPLGVLFSAIAAGGAVVYLVSAALGLQRRGRLAILVLSAVLVAGLPAWVLRGVSERTGIVRAQDRWAVQVQADAARLTAGKSPYATPAATAPIGRAAFSTSFRLEPPQELVPDRPLVPPGTSAIVALLRPLGLRDPRPLLLVAIAALAAIAWCLAMGARGPAAILPALVPPFLMGSVLGSPVALPAAALLGSLLAAERARPAVAGLLSGVAVAFDHRAVLVAPFLVVGIAPAWRRAATGFALGYGLLVLPVLALDPGGWLAVTLAPPVAAEPGVGLANVFFYRGAVPSPVVLAVAAGLVAAGLFVLVVKGRLDPKAGAAIASLSAALFSGEASAHGLPLALLALGGLGGAVDEGSRG
jgi:Glycosyltransferase family 87